MNRVILLTAAFVSSLSAVFCQISLLQQLNSIASQSKYENEVYSQLQAPFSIESVIATSMETAMQTCQSSFKWERWNCPSSDFIVRHTSKSLLMDREDSYIKAITTAAVLYTIAKNCSSGIIAECDACSKNPYSSYCSDNPKAAEKLFRQHISMAFSNDFNGKVAQHNYKVVTNLLEKSLVKHCTCAAVGARGVCSKEICFELLKPFEEIAVDIRQMYEEGIQITYALENTRILWDNIPLDVLVYSKDSPNYCEPDAVPHWNGMQGRRCCTRENSKSRLTKEQRSRCRYLCRECGYRVLPKNIATESSCNCKITWGFQVQCDKCVTVQRQYFCF